MREYQIPGTTLYVAPGLIFRVKETKKVQQLEIKRTEAWTIHPGPGTRESEGQLAPTTVKLSKVGGGGAPTTVKLWGRRPPPQLWTVIVFHFFFCFCT